MISGLVASGTTRTTCWASYLYESPISSGSGGVEYSIFEIIGV